MIDCWWLRGVQSFDILEFLDHSWRMNTNSCVRERDWRDIHDKGWDKGFVGNNDIFILLTPVGASKNKGFENVDTWWGSGDVRINEESDLLTCNEWLINFQRVQFWYFVSTYRWRLEPVPVLVHLPLRSVYTRPVFHHHYWLLPQTKWCQHFLLLFQETSFWFWVCCLRG